MTQRAWPTGPQPLTPRHTAIIMDGNGRWAQARRLPRTAGHQAGAGAVRRTIEAAPSLGIEALTLYAFSEDNWQRPRLEVQALMRLLQTYLRNETARCVGEGVRLGVIGRRDRLPAALCEAIAQAEEATSHGTTLHLRLAIDYSARAAIARGDAPLPDVDLLIRTGGEQRLSDFLLRECAYAELYFTATPWPEFDGDALAAAVAEFSGRQRRFGALTAVAS
ncbi:MAG TPA: polyprenyl diphosphate synthase [Longimicrobiales bacterium]|nr:polyprenyl diphosphate synthase [Longimicrobiales bacterium]